MADDVQRLLLQIDASATLLRQEVAKARGDIDNFADRSERRLRNVQNGFTGIGGAATAAVGKIAALASGLLSVGQAAQFIVRANADFQRLSAQLEVATGSTLAASAAMKELEQFAAETPFTLNQVVEGFIRLKNLGLDPNIETMRSFGNTSAAMGKDVMQFIEAVADAATGEFERLKEFGIKASKEGDKVKFTFQGVTTTVTNSADAITAYLKSLGDESGAFAGSMAKQMDTIDGKISNLIDSAGRLAVTIGQLGFSDFFMRQLEEASKRIEGLNQELRGTARIRQFEGTGAMMNATQDEKVEAGSVEGMRNRLTRQANDAMLARIAAERARERGQLIGGGAATIERTRQAEAEARERLTRFENQVVMPDIVGRFPLNERGQFGKAPKPQQQPASSTKTAKSKAAKAGPQEFTLASMEQGWALRQLSDAGTPANIEMSNQALRSVADTMDELASYDFQINPIGQEQIALAEDYTRTLTEGLAQAVVYGRNFGDVLKGLAQQIAASGLINILSGGKLGTSFGDALGGLGKIFGGKRETGGPVEKGKSYIVGEKRPELFVPKQDGFVMPRVPAEFGKGDDEEPRLAGLREQLQSLRLPAAPETNRAATAMQRDETPEQQATARLMKELKAKFGGFRETGGSVMPGKAYVVGEKRPEVFVPSTAGYIMPRVPTGQGGNGGQQSVSVTVNPSPLFITTVTQGAQMAAQETLRKTTRQRMPQSAGV